MLITVFSLCALLGALAGVLAGLLGIGGGLVIVPALVYLLPQLGVEPNLVMPMALATSLGAIVVTSSSAMFAHHKNANIPWHIAKPLILFVALGSFSGAFIAELLSTEALTNFFCRCSYSFGYLHVICHALGTHKSNAFYLLFTNGRFCCRCYC
jgi:hypothetical protein